MVNVEGVYTKVLQISVVFLSIALFWFAFMYYPKTVKSLEEGKFTSKQQVVRSVVATSYSFPIETSAYKIELGPQSGDYYVLVNGSDLGAYEANRNSARLALKTALSLENTCTINVVYISSANLAVPQSLKLGDCGRLAG